MRAIEALDSFSRLLRKLVVDSNLPTNIISEVDKAIQNLSAHLGDIVYEIWWLIWWNRDYCPICKLPTNNKDIIRVPKEYGKDAYKVHKHCFYELKRRASNTALHGKEKRLFIGLAYTEKVPLSIAFAVAPQSKLLDHYINSL